MKTREEKIEILNKIAKKDTSWMANQEWRMQNADWIRLSQKIALRILHTLDQKGWTQKDLADKMNVSPQQINKICKGNENLTLETIVKLEKSLGVKLIEIPQPKTKFNIVEDYSLDSVDENINEILFNFIPISQKTFTEKTNNTETYSETFYINIAS
ncbi:MAG: helix-turn-helix transcriptional regulator [Raineya sp.]|nr:helix-turn-helix transcriptional regulator [Raineya sp.]